MDEDPENDEATKPSTGDAPDQNKPSVADLLFGSGVTLPMAPEVPKGFIPAHVQDSVLEAHIIWAKEPERHTLLFSERDGQEISLRDAAEENFPEDTVVIYITCSDDDDIDYLRGMIRELR